MSIYHSVCMYVCTEPCILTETEWCNNELGARVSLPFPTGNDYTRKINTLCLATAFLLVVIVPIQEANVSNRKYMMPMRLHLQEQCIIHLYVSLIMQENIFFADYTAIIFAKPVCVTLSIVYHTSTLWNGSSLNIEGTTE